MREELNTKSDGTSYTVEHLDDGAGILVLDETCFLKKGHESAKECCSLFLKRD